MIHVSFSVRNLHMWMLDKIQMRCEGFQFILTLSYTQQREGSEVLGLLDIGKGIAKTNQGWYTTLGDLCQPH